MTVFVKAVDKVVGEVTTPADQMLKSELLKSGIDITGWDILAEQYYGRDGRFFARVDNIPAGYDENGVPNSFVPGLHVNIATAEAIDATGWDPAVVIENPTTPYSTFV